MDFLQFFSSAAKASIAVAVCHGFQSPANQRAVQLDDDPTFPGSITITSRLNSPHSVGQWRSAQAPDSAAQPGVQSGGGGGIQGVLVQPEGLKHWNLAHSRHQPVDSTAGPGEAV